MIDQTLSHSTVKPLVILLVKLVKHKSQVMTFKSSDCPRKCFLQVLVKTTITLEPGLCKAVIELRDVFWFHSFKFAFELFFEDCHQLIVNAVRFRHRDQNL